jgi:peptidoglycan/xylan/chitin deacetylase (PgdA/CDA1 family)
MRPVTHGPRDVPAVALTFDDGPGAITPRVLDILRDAGARGTFNLLGPRVQPQAKLIRRMVTEGHELAVHGWDHRDLTHQPFRSLAEIVRTRRAIRREGGKQPRLFRPPYGTHSRTLVLSAKALGLTTVNWDVDPRDYEEPGAATIRERVRAAVQPGSIVLLHDDRPELDGTAQALPRLLADLEARGLAAVTVTELLSRAGR